MVYFVRMIKEYEASIEVEADSAEQACEMISNGDFSQALDETYNADMSEESIIDVKVYDETSDEPLAEWNANDR